jgi:hypothetical protein
LILDTSAPDQLQSLPSPLSPTILRAIPRAPPKLAPAPEEREDEGGFVDPFTDFDDTQPPSYLILDSHPSTPVPSQKIFDDDEPSRNSTKGSLAGEMLLDSPPRTPSPPGTPIPGTPIPGSPVGSIRSSIPWDEALLESEQPTQYQLTRSASSDSDPQNIIPPMASLGNLTSGPSYIFSSGTTLSDESLERSSSSSAGILHSGILFFPPSKRKATSSNRTSGLIRRKSDMGADRKWVEAWAEISDNPAMRGRLFVLFDKQGGEVLEIVQTKNCTVTVDPPESGFFVFSVQWAKGLEKFSRTLACESETTRTLWIRFLEGDVALLTKSSTKALLSSLLDNKKEEAFAKLQDLIRKTSKDTPDKLLTKKSTVGQRCIDYMNMVEVSTHYLAPIAFPFVAQVDARLAELKDTKKPILNTVLTKLLYQIMRSAPNLPFETRQLLWALRNRRDGNLCTLTSDGQDQAVVGELFFKGWVLPFIHSPNTAGFSGALGEPTKHLLLRLSHILERLPSGELFGAKDSKMIIHNVVLQNCRKPFKEWLDWISCENPPTTPLKLFPPMLEPTKLHKAAAKVDHC